MYLPLKGRQIVEVEKTQGSEESRSLAEEGKNEDFEVASLLDTNAVTSVRLVAPQTVPGPARGGGIQISNSREQKLK